MVQLVQLLPLGSSLRLSSAVHRPKKTILKEAHYLVFWTKEKSSDLFFIIGFILEKKSSK